MAQNRKTDQKRNDTIREDLTIFSTNNKVTNYRNGTDHMWRTEATRILKIHEL
jgi:hypothetical protein